MERIKAIDTELNNLVLNDLEPLSESQKVDLETQSVRSRKEAVVMISKFEYKHALVKAKELVMISKKLFFNEPFKYFYTFLTDSLILAKCFIREDKFTQAEEVLVQGWGIFNRYITNDNYKISKVVFEERDEGDIEALQKYINTTTDGTEDSVREALTRTRYRRSEKESKAT